MNTDVKQFSPSELLHQARDSAASFATWIDEKVDPVARGAHPLELASWRKEVSLIQQIIEKPDRVRIALVGTTGAGKSTFLNAILGQEILPVTVMQPCTAFVTSVSYESGGTYRVAVDFCSRAEWQKDLEYLAAAMSPGEADEREDPGEGKRLIDAALKRLRAVYGIDPDPQGLFGDPLSLPLPAEAEQVFAEGSYRTLRFDDPKEMLTYLRKLIRGESPLWPLVKEVRVSGPYDCLTGGLELVDLPGLNDPNEARVEITREYLRTSPFVWVVFPMVRGLTDDIRRILREEKLLRTLVLSGSYDALSLVGTKADDIDTNHAAQLGLSEDCSSEELIRAYRTQTVAEARAQLEQLVRDLAAPHEHGETLDRMIDIARNVRVHTTSANAFNRLTGVGRLRKDYGLTEPMDTGIPGVHSHLREIADKEGLAFNARIALKRLDQLGDEIAFFFRAGAQAPTPAMEQARARIQQEHAELSTGIKGIQERAGDQLKSYRERFLEKLDPLLASSALGIQRITDRWRAIHWTTLRAIVQRDGEFKSPTTGRSYDLNRDLTEPLLKELPVSWERYFTDDLGKVTSEFVLRVTESTKQFSGKVRLIINLLFQKNDQLVESQLAWFQDKIDLLAQTSRNRITTAVRERRSELAAKMPVVARGMMQPGYIAAKQEKGTGVKQRMLGHLEPRARASAAPIFTTIQADLLEGLTDLELIVSGMLRELAQAAEEQARIVAHNASLDVDASALDPAIASLLNTMPLIMNPVLN